MHTYINAVSEGRVNILIAHVINDVLHEVKARKISVNKLWTEQNQTGWNVFNNYFGCIKPEAMKVLL